MDINDSSCPRRRGTGGHGSGLTEEHDGQRSFTVMGSDALPVGSVERFIDHPVALGYSPNTVKAYAHDLADLCRLA